RHRRAGGLGRGALRRAPFGALPVGHGGRRPGRHARGADGVRGRGPVDRGGAGVRRPAVDRRRDGGGARTGPADRARPARDRRDRRPRMTERDDRRAHWLLPGLGTGLVAALAMTLTTWLLRMLAGVPLPVELASDRIVPTLTYQRFGHLVHLLGGPQLG